MDIQSLISSLTSSNEIGSLSSSLGMKPEQTKTAIQSALPALLGAMAKNTNSPEGANALSNALDKDHDGSILDNLSGFFSQGNTSPGNSILKHVLGSNQNATASAIASSAGITGEQSGQIMAMVAPVLLGFLGKTKKSTGMDASGIAGMLSSASSLTGGGNGIMGQLTGFLDKDKDGDVMDDISGMIGGFFKK